MNIFIGFGYNVDDKWIKDLVFPLVESFDFNVYSGEDMHGEIISQGVKERILKAHGLLAFFTRREALTSGKYTSHRWVDNELGMAIDNNIPALEIREKLVDAQGGRPGDRQRIEFDLDDKAMLLVELAGILSKWKSKHDSTSLMILPDEIVQEARPYIKEGKLKCYYQFKNGNEETGKYETIPFRLPDSLGVDIKNIPSKNALIQMAIEGPGLSWSCGYQPFNLVPIKLQKD